MPITQQERAAALARLARSDVVGLRHAANKGEYEKVLADAFARFVTNCVPDLLPQSTITSVGGVFDAMEKLLPAVTTFEKMIELLNKARLTISFKCPNWFYEENKYASYTNFFERGVSGASNDMKKRDQAEMEFGRYAGGQQSALKNAQAAQQRIAQYGVKTSPDFRGAVMV